MMTKKEKPKTQSTRKTNPYGIVFLFIYMAILLFTFFKVYNTIFDEKVHLGGDNAGYYILGNSLASGEGYTNIHNKEKVGHNHFPVGYPLIMSVAIQLFSNDIGFIKKVNGFFLLVAIGLLFLVVYNLTSNYHLSFITCLFSLLNYHLLSYSTIMMSEIPFMVFLTLSLWLFFKTDFSLSLKKNWLFFILLICLSLTYHIRSMGLAIFVAIALFLILKKNWKYCIYLVSGFIILALPWYIRSKSLGGNAYMQQLFKKNPYRPELGSMEFLDWVKRFWINLERYISREIPSGVFNFIEVKDYTVPATSSEWLVGIFVLIIMGFGLMKLKKYLDIVLIYVIAYFGILLLWPDVWVGTRFLLPFIPFLSFFLIYGITELFIWVGKRVFDIKNPSIIYISVVVLFLFSIKSYAKYATDKLEKQAQGFYANSYNNYFELAKWVKKNTPDTSVTCCRKGQLFYLYSNKYVTAYQYTLDKEKQIEHLKSVGTDYVVLEQLGYSSTVRYLYPAIQRYPEKFEIVKHLKNPDTYLMKFLPELGYWGEWKNDKKHGKGVYGWSNGQKFEGTWDEDLKHGKGKLNYPNGQYLEGTWIKDNLSGEAVLKSKDGNVIERSMYRNNAKVKVIQ